MTHLYVPDLSIEPFEIGTNWSLTKSYLSDNNQKSQLCLLRCFTEDEATSLVTKIENIIRDNPNKDNFYLNAMGSNVVASRNLLEEVFNAELYLDAKADEKEVILINLETNSVFHMNLDLKATCEVNQSTAQANKRKHEEMDPQINQAICFPSLIEGENNKVLWINAGKFKGQQMVSLIGYDKRDHVIAIENFIKSLARKVKQLTDCNKLIGRKDTTLVASEEFLTSLLGKPVTLTNLQLTDKNKNRNDYIHAIYSRWLKDTALRMPSELTKQNPQRVVLNLPESATLDDYVNSGGTLSTGGVSSSFSTSKTGFFYNDTITSTNTAVTNGPDVQADAAAENWIRTILS